MERPADDAIPEPERKLSPIEDDIAELMPKGDVKAMLEEADRHALNRPEAPPPRPRFTVRQLEAEIARRERERERRPGRRARTAVLCAALALPGAPAEAAGPAEQDDNQPRIEQRVSLERVAIGSTLVAGGLLYLRSAAPCGPETGCHHEAVAQRAVAWYAIGTGALVLTRWLRVPVEARPLRRGALLTFTVGLGGDPRRPHERTAR